MWSETTMVASFDAEAGDIATLATTTQKRLWFNEGMARLLRRKPKSQDITWTALARSVALASDFVQLDKIVVDDAVTIEPWRVWGETLVLDDPLGATGAGTARVYYWGEWPEMAAQGGQVSELNLSQDYACLYYALSRFYRKLSSNRGYYKRYSTLVGQNAVTMSDLQQEADRYYQDFLDARDDLEPDPPAFFFNE